jgi:hypothetical protein
MMMTLELLTYRLTPGTLPETFLALLDQTRPALEGHSGLRSRLLACDGEIWTEVVTWDSRAHAEAAGEAIMADPRVAPLMAAIDAASLSMQFTPLLGPK